MLEKIGKLYNTMLLVETKGESTKIMGQCLMYTEELLKEINQQEQEKNEKAEPKEAAGEGKAA